MFEMPAFVDGHAHPLFAGRESLGPRLDGLTSIAQITAAVRHFAAANPDVYWVVGGAYDRSLSPTFEAKWIDEVVSDRPVVLHASDHHTIWVNTKALELAGITNGIPLVATGSADLDNAGKPNGTLRESGAMDLVLKVIPPLSIDAELQALHWAHTELLSNGIAAVQDAWIDRGMTEIYLAALQADVLKVRTNLAFRITPENYESDFDYFQQMRQEVTAAGSPLLTVKTVKFFADGVLGSGTAAVLEPYEDFGHLGEPVWNLEEFKKATKKYAEAGFQLHIHAIGDAGVQMALDVIANAKPKVQPSVIAHTELVAEADLGRFTELNVIANFEPLWARKDGMLLSCVPHLGMHRIDDMYRMRSLLEAGATLAFGSDWPVSNVSPLLGIQTAVTRAIPDGQSWKLEEALDLSDAIMAYTVNSRQQILDSSDFAEMVLLSANPFTTDPNEIHKIEVLAVRRGNQILFTR